MPRKKIKKEYPLTKEIHQLLYQWEGVEKLKNDMLAAVNFWGKQKYSLEDRIKIIKECERTRFAMWWEVYYVYPELKNKKLSINSKGIKVLG